MDRTSLFRISQLPNEFGVILLVVFLILLLAPYFSGADFGLFKIPAFGDRAKKVLQIIGPVLFLGCLLSFAPILPSNKEPASTTSSQTNVLTSESQLTPMPSPHSSAGATPGHVRSPLPSEEATPPGIAPTIGWFSIKPGDAIPPNAVPGGTEIGGFGGKFHVCRTKYEGVPQVGKVIGTGCNFGYRGNEHSLFHYDILTGSGSWGAPKPGYAGALIADHGPPGPLFICRAIFHGQHPGKIVNGKCNFGYSGLEKSSADFEVFYAAR